MAFSPNFLICKTEHEAVVRGNRARQSGNLLNKSCSYEKKMNHFSNS